MLVAPFLKRWTYTRQAEQVGPHAACLPPAGLDLAWRTKLACMHCSLCNPSTRRLPPHGTARHCPACRLCLVPVLAYSRPLPPSLSLPHFAAQMQGAHAFKPPKEDVNSPDLYIPTMALWTYTLLVCAVNAGRGRFNPDKVYPLVRAGGRQGVVADVEG